MLGLWIVSSFAARSQTTDTLCFPVPVIQKLLIDAKQKKLADSLNGVYRSDISILQSKIDLLKEKDSNHLQIESIYQGQVTALQKEVSKWKRKNKWTALSGIVLTAIVTGLFIFK